MLKKRKTFHVMTDNNCVSITKYINRNVYLES